MQKCLLNDSEIKRKEFVMKSFTDKKRKSYLQDIKQLKKNKNES